MVRETPPERRKTLEIKRVIVPISLAILLTMIILISQVVPESGGIATAQRTLQKGIAGHKDHSESN